MAGRGAVRQYDSMRHAPALLAVTVLLTSCGGDGISVYEIPKDAAVPRGHAPVAARGTPARAAPAMPGSMEGAPMMPIAHGTLGWTVPAGWSAQGPSGMRLETFKMAGGAEISVVTLPGDSGGLLANVNRWRGQLNQPGWDDAELARASSRIRSAAGESVFVECAAKDGTSALAGGILLVGGATWFFKATGPVAAVKAAVPAVRAFLGSLRPGGGS